MSTAPLGIRKTGLVTAVGRSAAATCSAVRAKVTNPSATRFIDSSGDWIMAHQVALEQPWRGQDKLVRMLAPAVEEALEDVPRREWPTIPLLLCVAERDRPGRLERLDDRLFHLLQDALAVRFHSSSAIVPQGRVGVALALAQARELLGSGKASQVLVAAVDSLLSGPTLSHYEQRGRLLTAGNSDGFMPGEGAGALRVGRPEADDVLMVTGLGFGTEAAHIDSELPLRADGLTTAIKAALADAGVRMQDMVYRITDAAGEQFYFKEAALALGRTLHTRKEEFDLWHPAECTGEVGAAAGASVIAVADAACRKAYGPGATVLAHFGNDGGRRAAVTLRYGRT